MFESRITGAALESAPGRFMPGEFMLLSEENPVAINGQEASIHDLLICDLDGVCRLNDQRFACDRCACLPEETDAIDRLGAEVAGHSREWMWEGLLTVGVVDPGWQEDLGRHPLELAIKEYLPYLRNVFHRPIRHLRIDTESVLTAKARRLAKAAPDYLAAHPEDWDGRTVLGVKPKRVLAKVRQEELDIYENRLAVRLVDHLSLFLARRIRRLREIEGMLAAVGDFGQQLRGSHWLQNRVSRLWGDTMQSSRCLHVARELQKNLTQLRVQLLGMMDTELYENVPRRARIAGQIRMTNILRNDANYRFVAILWQTWFELAGEKPETDADFYRRMQRVHERHAQVSTMYVVKALAQLGFTEVTRNADLMQPDSELVVTRPEEPRITASIRRKENRTLFVGVHDRPVLRIAPVFYGLLDLMTERSALAYLEALRAGPRGDIPCLVVFPGSMASSRSALPSSVQDRMTFAAVDIGMSAGAVRFVPVSPYDITSTERLARCLRWFIFSGYFLQYPWMLPANSQAILTRHGLLGPAPHTLIKTDSGTRIGKIDQAQRLIEEMAGKCETLEKEVAASEAAATHFEDLIQKKHHDPSLRGQARAAKEKARTARAQLAELDPLRTDLARALSYTRSLMTCPCCGTVNADAASAVLRDNATFGVKCVECECEWGIGICGECHRRYPFIRIARIERYIEGVNAPGWEEMTVGQDILATPRLLPDGTVRFECPWCGHV